MYNVIRTGGSIGEIHAAQAVGKWDAKNQGIVVKTFNQKEEAHEFAKAMRSGLTPGEKSYYKMGYKTVLVK
jgi:hypothetical protein